jgi:hypothetical protein
MYSIKLLSMAFCLAIRVVPHSQGNLSSWRQNPKLHRLIAVNVSEMTTHRLKTRLGPTAETSRQAIDDVKHATDVMNNFRKHVEKLQNKHYLTQFIQIKYVPSAWATFSSRCEEQTTKTRR